MPHAAALLIEQRHHDVGRLDELVVASYGEALGVGQRHLELGGESIGTHGAPRNGCL